MTDHASTVNETVSAYAIRLESLRLGVQLAGVGRFDEISHRLDAALGAAKVFEAMLTPVAAPADASAEKAAEDCLEEILNGGRVTAKTTIQGIMGGVQIRAEVETGPGVACLLLIGEDDLRRFVREECAKISAAADQAPKRVMDGMGGFNPVEPTPASDLQGGG